jgi:hypothetical protein
VISRGQYKQLPRQFEVAVDGGVSAARKMAAMKGSIPFVAAKG